MPRFIELHDYDTGEAMIVNADDIVKMGGIPRRSGTQANRGTYVWFRRTEQHHVRESYEEIRRQLLEPDTRTPKDVET